MTNWQLKRATLVFALLAFLNPSAFADADSNRDESLVIFGDSLSDTGNKHAVNDNLSLPPYDMLDARGIPSDPYANGGIHFSNGQIWIERVAKAVAAQGNEQPVLKGHPAAQNYAWGGARAYPDNANRHLPEQITSYLADVNYAVDPATLYVIFIGGNDIVAALEALGPDPSSPNFAAAIQRVGLAGGAIQQSVQALVDLGARRFLILNVPNVGLVPALDGPAAGLASCFAILLNTGATPAQCGSIPPIPFSIDSVVAGLEANSQVEVTAVDVFSFISGVAAYPDMFGLSNVTDKCLMPNQTPSRCAQPSDYLFWDGIHPTRIVHRLLASVVMTALEP